MRSALALVPPATSDAGRFCDQLLDWARG
jgi:hypothetical protein